VFAVTALDPRRLAAEFTGAALLVFGGGGAAVISGQNLTVSALGHLLALGIAVYAFAGISGGHVNPAVTIALAAGRYFPWRQVPGYVIAQILGGIAGAGLLAAAYGDIVLQAGLGATRIDERVASTTALYIEALGTFILVLAVMAFAVNPRAPRGLSGLGIGGALAAVILVVGPTTGAALNLARAFGPETMLWLTGNGNADAWKDMYIYTLGPVIGAAIAVLVYSWMAGMSGTVDDDESDASDEADDSDDDNNLDDDNTAIEPTPA